jgi:DNA polymerase III subunit alpha
LTSGVFQFESSGMRDVLRRYQPNSIEDLTALNALYRPGPMAGRDDRRLYRAQAWTAQDRIRIARAERDFAGDAGRLRLSGTGDAGGEQTGRLLAGEADLLRRAMGKKNAEEMAKQRERFVQGATKNGFPPKKIEKIFDLMAQFAGYGFNKSHSAAYALLAYHTAYLKTHHPLDFMAALLTSITGDTDSVVKYINECREMGIAVEPPDINVSDANFTPHGQAIRFGLAAVKNVGGNAIESIVGGAEEAGAKFQIVL